ncbi:piezo-type mechanosensitive ion channel component 2 [Brachionus plicatilis]|uniref:Piezo-type mechanosensitive ion channel component 2 n=1 Tax=Brachionus plicatilis TaxID=10195 RepID=A0A3M7SW70_BRAPC|nr:piezo-type mechanosensitive ion channel component 2 [Brachionus plicatilis]
MDLVNEASNSGIDDIIVVKANDSILNGNLEARLIQDQSTLSATNQQPSGFESTQDVAKNPSQTPSQFSGARFITLYKRIILRPNFQSLIHLFLLFYLPFLYPINESSLSNHFKKFILFLMGISCVSLTGQLIFQIVIISAKSDLLPNCSLRQEIFQEFGYARFDQTFVGDIFRVLSPDVILLVGAFITYLINRKYSSCIIEQKRHLLYKYPNQSTKDTTFTDHFCPLKNVNEHEPVTPATSRHTVDSNKQNLAKQNTKIKRFYKIALSYINQILFMCLLFSCASIWPSLLSIPYFMAFVFLATKWSVTGRLKATRTQFYTKIFFIFYTSLHTLTIYLYQLDLFEQLIEPNTFLARLIGLNQIIQWKCEQPSHIYLNPNLELTQVFQPLLCIFLYWLIALELSYGLEKTLPLSPHIAEFSPEINVDKPLESDHQKNNDFDEINEKQVIFFAMSNPNKTKITVRQYSSLYSSTSLTTNGIE